MATPTFLLGLAGCVDYELVWDPARVAQLAQAHAVTLATLDSTTPVTNATTWFQSLLGYVQHGEGGEQHVASSALARDIGERFAHKATLGGTGVRAAIALARLGIRSTVHLVSTDDTVRELLPPEVDYVCSADKDSLDPHVIFQYPAGTTVPLTDGTITAPHPNRVIYVNDLPGEQLILSDRLPELVADADRILVAGLNVMKDPRIALERTAQLNTALTAARPGTTVYFEDAGFHSPQIKKLVLGALDHRPFTVHGMNEDELMAYLHRPVDLMNPAEVHQALLDVRHHTLAPVTVVHTKHWALACGPHARDLCDHLTGGVDLASARFVHGDDLNATNLAHIRQTSPRVDAQAFAKTLAAMFHDPTHIACVPGRGLRVDHPTTIGLGDTFVAGFLAHDLLPKGDR